MEYLLEHPNEKFVYMYKEKDLYIFKVYVVKLKFENMQIYEVVFNDVTEIELQKQRYSQAIEGSHEGLWEWNLRNNTLYLSDYFKKMLGYEENELKNDFASFKNIVHPEDLEQVMQDIQNNIDKKIDFYHNVHRLRHKNRSWVWIDDRGKTFYDKQGNAVRMVGTHTDITMLKKSEANNILHAKSYGIL